MSTKLGDNIIAKFGEPELSNAGVNVPWITLLLNTLAEDQTHPAQTPALVQSIEAAADYAKLNKKQEFIEALKNLCENHLTPFMNIIKETLPLINLGNLSVQTREVAMEALRQLLTEAYEKAETYLNP